jgi:hypothetical protein
MEKKTKCVQILEFVNLQQAEKEFRIRDLASATGISRYTISKVLFPLTNLGLLNYREVSRVEVYYSRTSAWNLNEAIRLNSERMKAQARKYKHSRS